MSAITPQVVEHIANLAQLTLDAATKERLVQELSDIVAYVDQLKQVDTGGVEPMMHALPMTNVFRDDTVGASLPREAALKNAPMHDDEYFIVPKILDTGDEG